MWLLNFEQGFDLAHVAGWDDGIDAEVPDLDEDRFVYRGRPLRVVWLSGREAEEYFLLNRWESYE